MRRITPASDERTISGSVNRGRACEIGLVVEADADAVGDAAAAAGALVRRGLADRLDRQLLDLAAKAVALDARRAGIDHVADAGHGQRGLGDVGREHDAARAVRREDLVLLLLAAAARTAAAPRRRADGACAAARRRRGSRARRAGTRARRRRRPRWPRHSSSTASQIASPRSWSRLSSKRPPADLDRVQSRPDTSMHRRRPVARGEMAREALGVDGRRGDDDLQVGPARQDLAQVAEQEVDVQAALVRLVDDDRVVGAQQRVALRLGEQDAVGHQLDARRRPRAGPGSAPCSRPRSPERRLQLLGDALGDAGARRCGAAGCGRSGRRRWPGRGPVRGDLRQLRRLARAGLAGDDDRLVRAQCSGDVAAPRRDRQRLGEIRSAGEALAAAMRGDAAVALGGRIVGALSGAVLYWHDHADLVERCCANALARTRPARRRARPLALDGAEPALPSSFAVGTAAQASLAAAPRSRRPRSAARATARAQDVARRHARRARSSAAALSASTAPRREAWDPIAGLYPCGPARDARLGSPAHQLRASPRRRAAAARPAGRRRDTSARRVAARAGRAGGAERSRAPRRQAGLVVAALRDFADWDAHPQHGALVAPLPLVEHRAHRRRAAARLAARCRDAARPLDGPARARPDAHPRRPGRRPHARRATVPT